MGKSDINVYFYRHISRPNFNLSFFANFQGGRGKKGSVSGYSLISTSRLGEGPNTTPPLKKKILYGTPYPAHVTKLEKMTKRFWVT